MTVAATTTARKPTVLMLAAADSVSAAHEAALSTSFVVEMADEARGAAELLMSALIDFVVIDFDASAAGGATFLQKLRREPRLRTIPCVALASRPYEEVRLRALQGGADVFVGKPCRPEELLATLRALLGRVEALRASARARRYNLAGDFGGMSFPALANLLELTRKTGTLALRAGRTSGLFLFEGGALLQARFGNLRGEAAFFQMLHEETGEFEFEPDGLIWEENSPRIDKSVTALLIEGTHALDERRVAHHQTPRKATPIMTQPVAIIPASRGPRGLEPTPSRVEAFRTAIADPFNLGQLRLLGPVDWATWFYGKEPAERLRLLLIADRQDGVRALAALATQLSEADLAQALATPPHTIALSFDLAEGRQVDVLLLDHTRLHSFLPQLERAAAAAIIAPPLGDFLGYTLQARADLETLLRDITPQAWLCLGNSGLPHAIQAIPGAKTSAGSDSHLEGMLSDPSLDFRDVLSATINAWAGTGEASASHEVAHATA